jgi:membrane associated rhomboid family serine protease
MWLVRPHSHLKGRPGEDGVHPSARLWCVNRLFWACVDWVNRRSALVRGLVFGLTVGLAGGILFAAMTGRTMFLIWIGSGLLAGLAAFVVILFNESKGRR